MGFHGHFLEFLGGSICTFYIFFFLVSFLNSLKQSYVYSVVYMASHDPSTYRFTTGGYVFIYTVLCTAYYMFVSWQCVPIPFLIYISPFSWDTAMAQKSRFKMQTQGITTFRKTFPQLPGCVVKNPTFIQTAHG